MSDAVTHWGWLRSQGAQNAVIRLDSPLPFVEGEEYLLQVVSGSRVTTDTCWLVGVQERDVEVRLRGEAKVSAPIAQPRASVSSLSAKVANRDRESSAQIVDASETGAGLLCWMSAEPGSQLTVTVSTDAGAAVASAEVRYCRVAQQIGQYRIGVQILEGNLGTVPWARAIQPSPVELPRAA